MASIEWRSENKCRLIVSKPKPSGKGYERIKKTITFPAGMTEKQRKKEAEKAALLFEEEVRNGDYLDGEKITLAEFVDIWMKEYAEKELAPSTLVHYRTRLERRILPALGHFKLAKMQPNHITAFYNNLTETGVRMDVLYSATDEFLKLIEGQSQRSLGEKIGVERHAFAGLRNGKCIYFKTAQKICDYFSIDMEKYFIQQKPDQVLSAKSIRHHHTLLSGILSFAMEWNLIKDNPAQRVRLPSITKAKSAKVQYYDDKQVAELFMALEDEPIKYRTILYLTVDTGLRLSEIAGLTWNMVDLEQQTITIVQQRQYVEGYGVIEGNPKTDSGIRTVTISKMITQKLTEYKNYQAKMRLSCGVSWHESNFVFTHDDGTPIFPRRPSVWFSQFIKRKGLPYITFHGIRHTNASLLIAGGVDIVTLSGRLGHADKNVTLNTYSHIIKSREKLAANKMDQFYESASGGFQGNVNSLGNA